MQLVLGKRGSAETHLPGGDNSLLLFFPTRMKMFAALSSSGQNSTIYMDDARVGNHEKLLQLQHEIKREFELIKMVG